ncbi:MAG: hypothetical protein QNJ45_16205 [Ardenticatenaceae bacterium]|nr:hypothetical protein [Ardenticatenaceae bacterium]
MRHLTLISGILLFALLIGCGGSDNNPSDTISAQQASALGDSDFSYIISEEGSKQPIVTGNNIIEVSNNCGSQANSTKVFSRMKTFEIVLDADITESLGGMVGGDIVVAEAEIQAAIEAHFGVQIGVAETVGVELIIETPKESISETTLYWEELWDIGKVQVQASDGNEISEIPFRLLTSLNLVQKEKIDTPCGIVNEEDSLADVNEVETLTEIPTSADITLPTSTSTPSPSPSNTSTPTINPTPEPTLTPSNTSTPTITPEPIILPIDGLQASHIGHNGPDVVRDGDVGGSYWAPPFVPGETSITLLFSEPRIVEKIRIHEGDGWSQPKDIIIEFQDGSIQSASFRGLDGWEDADLAPVMTNEVTIIINDIFTGSKTSRLAISEIQILGRR